jgi:endonuclease/exonuclease/phosphatase family metal-dependent hydrolase
VNLRDAALELGLLLVAVAAFALGRPPAPEGDGWTPRPRGAGEARVVTWNVGRAHGRSGWPLAEEDLESVAADLLALDADVVVLQELEGHEQLRRLVERLGPAWTAFGSSGRGRVVALLARGPEVVPLEVDALGGRIVGARVATPAGALALVGVHADVRSSARRNETLGGALARLLATEADARVLLGDLNLDLDLDKRGDLFTDDEHGDARTYNHLTGPLFDAGLGRGATAEPDRRLDYVLPERGRLAAVAAGPWRERRKEGMDHDPLVADLVRAAPALQGSQ